MRTTQDRINLLLNHFGQTRILENMLSEDIVFCKGNAYTYNRMHEMKCIAKFGFNTKSVIDFEHSYYCNDHTKFNKPFHLIENDESQYLQVQFEDYDGFIYKENKREDNIIFSHNKEIFDILGKMAGAEMARYFINNRFEEFEGAVSHSYEVMVDIGNYGNAGFNAQSTDLASDELFLSAVQYFIKENCKKDISVDDLQHDLIGSISNLTMC